MKDAQHTNEIDLPYFREVVAPRIPSEVLDFHAHTWTDAQLQVIPWEENAAGGKYMVTTTDYPIETLVADGRRLFPDRAFKAVLFGHPTPASDLKKMNDYAVSAGADGNLFPLMITGRDLDSRDKIEQRILHERIYGFKVLLPWFGDDYGEVGVRDMIGPIEMELADKYRLVVLLHVPGSERLADPEIQAGVRELSGGYPNARIVLAHCGRCYHPDRMQRAVGCLRDLANVYLDSSMVMDPMVIRIVLENLGPERLLFGTDLPVAAMRGRRVNVMDHWVDVVLPGPPESAFRVQSADIRATFMVYEIITAILCGADSLRLSEPEIRAIFHDNGMGILNDVQSPGIAVR